MAFDETDKQWIVRSASLQATELEAALRTAVKEGYTVVMPIEVTGGAAFFSAFMGPSSLEWVARGASLQPAEIEAEMDEVVKQGYTIVHPLKYHEGGVLFTAFKQQAGAWTWDEVLRRLGSATVLKLTGEDARGFIALYARVQAPPGNWSFDIDREGLRCVISYTPSAGGPARG